MRPMDWRKEINQESETCHWVAPDGSIHPATDEENAEVRRHLLDVRERGAILERRSHEH